MAKGIRSTPRPQVLSIPERLDADVDVHGSGVVMALVDTGFFPHPDLMRPEKRIVAYIDAARDEPLADDLLTPHAWAWHGTMTACAAAGNGYLSGGRYRGLASAAEVVLIKCSDDARALRARHVAHAIRAPLRYPKLGVRVLNVSVGVDRDDPEVPDVLAAVREVTRAGVAVFAAAGNREGEPPEPPASAPEAITVGGWNDANTRDPSDDLRFPGNYGGEKPDLLAPAMWLPAPMLPGTPEAREAVAMFQVVAVLEELLERAEFLSRDKSLSERDKASIEATLAAATARIEHQKYIATDYQHVEGTSFAAPITASVGAQMIEVDPTLGPRELREGLLATARPIEGVPREQQGAGLLQPAAAVAWARARAARRVGLGLFLATLFLRRVRAGHRSPCSPRGRGTCSRSASTQERSTWSHRRARR
jgi:serine protease AprX